MRLRFTMTRERALELGLLFCKTCGHPPNNHFDHGTRPCAHDKCTAYVEGTRDGVVMREVP